MAVAITSGAAIFKLNEDSDAPVKNTQFIGIVFIVTYMATDSFTSNWQSKMFKQYGVTSMVMMLYANLFSSGFTALGLVLNLEILSVLSFIAANQAIMWHISVMAICSAVGPAGLKGPSTLFDDTAPSARLVAAKAQAAPTVPRAQPGSRERLPRPQQLCSGRPKS